MVKPASALTAVFLFNHRYEQNVAKLERLYSSRFSTRKYIMPFASRNDEQVARVYETSWNFSGHIAQAGHSIMVPGTTHYVFIADDLILNPRLNEGNLLETLSVGKSDGYIKSIASIDTMRYHWWRSLPETINLDGRDPGFDWRSEIPSAAEAQKKFEQLGVVFRKLKPRSVREFRWATTRFPRMIGAGAMLRYAGKRTSYPLIYGYSDFLVVPAAAMERFVHYCGVFAALNCFAEVAVPTALALACDALVTELEPNEHFEEPARRCANVQLKGLELWGEKAISAFAKPFDQRFDHLISGFPEELLYVHPVKLSRFK